MGTCAKKTVDERSRVRVLGRDESMAVVGFGVEAMRIGFVRTWFFPSSTVSPLVAFPL